MKKKSKSKARVVPIKKSSNLYATNKVKFSVPPNNNNDDMLKIKQQVAVKDTVVVTVALTLAIASILISTMAAGVISGGKVKGAVKMAGTVTTYYVDCAAVAGGDGTLAKPYKTLVNGVSTGNVLLKRGCIFRSSIFIPEGSSNIIYADYGDANLDKPSIVGSNPIAGWTLISGNIWQTSLIGANAWINPTTAWADDENVPEPVLLFINCDAKSNCRRGTKKFSALTSNNAVGDWYYSPSTKILTLVSASSPSGVEIARRNAGILGYWGGNSSSITVKNLEIKNTIYKGIGIGNSDNSWTLDNLTIHHTGVVYDDATAIASYLGLDSGSFYGGHGISVGDSNSAFSSAHTIKNCTVYESGGNNIHVQNSPGTAISKNTVYNAHHHNINVFGASASASTITGMVISYNKSFFDTSTGFDEESGHINNIYVGDNGDYPNLDGVKIYYNTITGINKDLGIEIYGTTLKNIGIYNNTIIASSEGISLDNMASAAVVKIQNNLIKGAYGITYNNTATTNKAVDHNMTVTADPGFVNLVAKDYHLLASSAAVNAGVVIAVIPQNDFGVSAISGLPDIGAYEYQGTANPVPVDGKCNSYTLGSCSVACGTGTQTNICSSCTPPQNGGIDNCGNQTVPCNPTCTTGSCVNGACVCTPKTCAQLGKACGNQLNGCGGTVNCGSCDAAHSCSSGNCVDKTCTSSACCAVKNSAFPIYKSFGFSSSKKKCCPSSSSLIASCIAP